MKEIKKGDAVRHKRWDTVGTVVRRSEDRTGTWIFVQWHNTVVEDQLSPDDVEVVV